MSKRRLPCPECGKPIRRSGLAQHRHDAHRVDDDALLEDAEREMYGTGFDEHEAFGLDDIGNK